MSAIGQDWVEASVVFVSALRAGIEAGRQSLGLGLTPLDNLDLDLAYLQHDELAATYQFSASFRF